MNSRPIREFSPDASGFETLLEEEYKAISDVDKAFVKAIPSTIIFTTRSIGTIPNEQFAVPYNTGKEFDW